MDTLRRETMIVEGSRKEAWRKSKEEVHGRRVFGLSENDLKIGLDGG